jgi:glycosyltransferase involved in cell wall biosynthesis
VDTEKRIKGCEVDFKTEDGVPVVRVYYNGTSNPLLKAVKFWKANLTGIKRLEKELGSFDVIHVHILTRLGLIALYYKWRKGVPYMISEHWSRYLELTNGFNGFLRKWLTRLVVKNAEMVTTVTQNMTKAMKSHKLFNKNYRLLANVVDEPFLTTRPSVKTDNNKKRLLHVSCFEDASKNVSGIVKVLAKLKDRNDFEFHFVGDGMDFKKIVELAEDLGLDKERIRFLGLMDSKQIAAEMAQSDLLVMFSNYENFPVVINEAFCMGVPVLSTAVGGIPERVNSSNGILIDPRDEKALETSVKEFLDGKISFDTKELMKKSREEFSAETIGGELCSYYNGIIKGEKLQKR